MHWHSGTPYNIRDLLLDPNTSIVSGSCCAGRGTARCRGTWGVHLGCTIFYGVQQLFSMWILLYWVLLARLLQTAATSISLKHTKKSAHTAVFVCAAAATALFLGCMEMSLSDISRKCSPTTPVVFFLTHGVPYFVCLFVIMLYIISVVRPLGKVSTLEHDAVKRNKAYVRLLIVVGMSRAPGYFGNELIRVLQQSRLDRDDCPRAPIEIQVALGEAIRQILRAGVFVLLLLATWFRVLTAPTSCCSSPITNSSQIT